MRMSIDRVDLRIINLKELIKSDVSRAGKLLEGQDKGSSVRYWKCNDVVMHGYFISVGSNVALCDIVS